MGKVSAPRVLKLLKEMRGQAALRSAVAEARLNKTSLLQNFTALFPTMFKTEKRNGTLYVSSIVPSVETPAAQSAPAPPQRVKINEHGQFMCV